jgi:two-component system chemotaxis response regulator CheB
MKNIVCIGGSSGSLDALRRILRHLPGDFPASIFVVRHIAPGARELLGEILRGSTKMPVTNAIDGEPFKIGHVYLAPPDKHLILDQTAIRLANGPKENWSRPAIDPLFRSAAQFHGRSTIGILLSGKLDDGTAGLWTLRRRGGMTVVQEPADAESQAMPRNAIAAVDIHVVASAEKIGAHLLEWCKAGPVPPKQQPPDKAIEIENSWLLGRPDPAGLDAVGVRARLICPECGGPLWKLKNGPLRYRCHVGHAESGHTLLARHREKVEAAGWQLLRTLEEDIDLVAQCAAILPDTGAIRGLEERTETNIAASTEVRRLIGRTLVRTSSAAAPIHRKAKD